MNATVNVILEQRRSARARVLDQMINLATNDPRICAAWLFGSEFRRTADALSDIDIWTVVDDAHINEIVTNRHAFITQIGEPLLVLDVPGNAPIDGGYLMVQYAGPDGPIQVDWYWQHQRHAQIPNDAKVLFDRVGLRQAADKQSTDFCYLSHRIKPPASATKPSRCERLVYCMTFFWSLSLIGAKKIARGDGVDAAGLINAASSQLSQIHTLLDDATLPRPAFTIGDPANGEPTLHVLLAALRTQAVQMETLAASASALGATLPPSAVSAVYHFYELVEEIHQEGKG